MTKVSKRAALPTIVVFLILSAGLRIGMGAQAAFANDGPPVVPDLPIDTANTDAKHVTDLLDALAKREARLDAQETLISDRMEALKLVDAQVSEKLTALQAAEESLSETIAQADGAAKTDVLKLTEVYENMNSKDAAALFEQMPPSFAAGFLGMMEPGSAAEIMAAVAPETAYSFSVVLAGRNANVPTR